MRNAKRLKGICLLIAIGSIALVGSTRAYEAFHGPTELIYSDPEKTAPGYLLLPSWPRIEEYEYSYLINLDGEVVHMWKTVTPEYEGQGYLLEKTSRFTEKGSIIQGLSTDAHSTQGQRVLQELDWDGNLVWAFSDPREGYLYHHNFKRIWNNHLNDWTIIFTSLFPMTQEQAVAAGADPSVEWDAAPDGVVEVDMNGNVVWEWLSLDHVIQDQNPDWPNYGVLAEHPERFDLNWGAGLTGDFIHQNALDYHREKDQIVVNNDRMGELYVIDHGGTFVVEDFEASKALAAGPKGDIIFRWGNPALYDSGEAPNYNPDGDATTEGDRMLFHHHDTQWIKEGLPGAGNFLIFDNGSRRAGGYFSVLLEVNPYDGAYPDAPYLPEMEAGRTRQPDRLELPVRKPQQFLQQEHLRHPAAGQRQHTGRRGPGGPHLPGDAGRRGRLGIHRPGHGRTGGRRHAKRSLQEDHVRQGRQRCLHGNLDRAGSSGAGGQGPDSDGQDHGRYGGD